MSDLLLKVVPGLMGKYEYARDLLKWAENTVSNIQTHKSTTDYPLMEPLLLASLEKVSQDLGSVELLKFVIELRKLDDLLKKTHQNHDDTSSVLDTNFSLKAEIPKVDAILKARLGKYAWQSILCFGLLVLIIIGPTVAQFVITIISK